MMRWQGLWLVLLALTGIGETNACTVREALTPRVMDERSFHNDTAFGTLALRFRDGRIGLLDSANCFHVGPFVVKGGLQFVVNNELDEVGVHYLSAIVVRTFSDERRNDLEFMVSFHRNGSDTADLGAWAETLEIGGGSEGAEATVKRLPAIGLSSSEDIVLSTIVEVDAQKFETAGPIAAEWHAWLIDSQDLADGDNTAVLQQDTRLGLHALDVSGLPIVLDEVEIVRVRLHLKRFDSSPSPSAPRTIFDTSLAGVQCIYVRFSIDGTTERILGTGGLDGEFLTLPIAANASC